MGEETDRTADGNQYRSLNPESTIRTIEKLNRRIEERFPNSGLGKVCLQLLAAARETTDEIEWLKAPNKILRFTVGITIALGLILLIYSFTKFGFSNKTLTLKELIPLIEAFINDKVVEVSRSYDRSQSSVVAALDRFSEDELKHREFSSLEFDVVVVSGSDPRGAGSVPGVAGQAARAPSEPSIRKTTRGV